jgi:hypothetical protein
MEFYFNLERNLIKSFCRGPGEKREVEKLRRQMKVEKISNEKLLLMLHGSRGTVFSKRVPLAAGGLN